MPKEDRKEYFRTLGLDNCSSENEIKRAYKKLALQFHPDKSFGDCSASKFEDIGRAFKVLTSEMENDSVKTDFDKMFFDFFRDILFGKKEGVSMDFLPFFCGAKSHGTCCSRSEGDYEYRCQDGEEEYEVDGEKELDSFIDIVKTRRKFGKNVPPEFAEDRVIVLKDQLMQHKEEMRKDGSKKQQASKKGKSSVPVAKPKPKSKKELLAEQRRRQKEMQQIAVELEEKRKEEEEKEKQRKQMEAEKQKRQEEERIKTQNEERKRREKEQKEREKQQKLDLEKEERRLRQLEEERKRKEEEEKRKKAEKEKAEKEKAARKAAAQQLAREKEEQARAANKNMNNKRQQQQQQQRTDQQQYPREIPPRFQKRFKQQQQSQMQSSLPQTIQVQQNQSPQQKPSTKPQPLVSKKKDPNRFASKEFAGLVDEVRDGGWSEAPSSKGSGWGNSLENWDNDDKWGTVDRSWGGKEGAWDQVVYDETDKDSWPTVGIKGTVGDMVKTSKSNTTEKNKIADVDGPFPVTSTAKATSDSSKNNSDDFHEQKLTSSGSGWQNTVYPSSSENWDIADESLDQALDAADAVRSLGAGWGGAHPGGLGGIIGSRFSSNSQEKDSSSKNSSVNDSSNPWDGETLNSSESQGWSKTPGKGPKTKPNDAASMSSGSTNLSSSWGGTPADSSSGWSSASVNSKGSNPDQSKWGSVSSSNNSSSFVTTSTCSDQKSSKTTNDSDLASGWGDSTVVSNWGTVPNDVTGTSCWDNAGIYSAMKNEKSEWKTGSEKVAGYFDSGVSSSDIGSSDWGQSRDQDESSEGSWDGWTTASKRNKVPKPQGAQDGNVWFSRSLKKLLDMGFKQEEAEKALKSNHLNIESAIGDLLSLNIGSIEDPVPVVPTMTKEPDPAEAAQIVQQQPKLNRKQRRKLQQQQQAELAKEQQSSQAELKQTAQTTVLQHENNMSNILPVTDVLETTNKTEQISSLSEQITEPSDVNKKKSEDASAKQNTSKQLDLKPVPDNSKPSESPQVATKSSSVQGSPNLNKRPNNNLSSLGGGVQLPIRQPLAHPLLQQQIMQQQLHMQQLRMAQGGLLQPPHLTPQQLVLLQQIAQLQMVQQRLAAQSIAQQHLGQKHGQSGLHTQQQLFQQQQQIAVMIAQMQQQLLQQQPTHLGGRFPAGSPPTLQQQAQQASTQHTVANQLQKGATNAKHQPSQQQQDEKTVDEIKNRTDNKSKPQTGTQKEKLVLVEGSVSSDHSKQASPALQSRLQQYKQPLLPEPSNDMASATAAVITKSNSLSVNTDTPAVTEQWNGPSKSDSGTPLQNSSTTPSKEAQNNGLSPRTRNRISDPVSSRWGVDAGPKLSADPPEFKPGVPWRPRENISKQSKEPSSAPAISTASSTVVSVSFPSNVSQADSSTENWSKSVSSALTTSSSDKSAVSSNTPTQFTETSIPSTSSTGQSQTVLGVNSPWQIPGDKSVLATSSATANKTQSAVGSGLRPPPGLITDKPSTEEEQPNWLKNLIGANSDSAKTDFQFSQFGFVGNTPWSHNHEGAQLFGSLNPVPPSWAAPGGPSPSVSSPGSSASTTSSNGLKINSSTLSGAPDISKRPNLGISSWSSTHPIPSAQELSKAAAASSMNTPTTITSGSALIGANPMSTWLVLQNLTPKVDPGELRSRCQQHGSLLTFQLNLRHGNSLIRYGSKEIAAKARESLNSAVIGGGPITADFATDADIGSFFEQTMDWSNNAIPGNTVGTHWPFHNNPKNVASADGTVTNLEPSNVSASLPAHGNGDKSTPDLPWGVGGVAPLPSQLWGSMQGPGAVGNRFMAPQGTTGMWSFGAGFPQEVESQSGSNENGLVSPSMTTFLPPGLLNGGESA